MSKNTKRKRGKSSQVSGSSRIVARVLGAVIMFAIVSIVALAFYNFNIKEDGDETAARHLADETPAEPAGAQQPRNPPRSAKYSFYDELKKRNNEVQAEVQAKTRALENAPAAKGTYYRVQVGAFKDADQADRLRARLILRDYPVTILQSDNHHLVQVGPYSSRDEAKKIEENLKKSGFKVLLKKFESN